MILNAWRHFRIAQLIQNAELNHFRKAFIKDFRRQSGFCFHQRSGTVYATTNLHQNMQCPFASNVHGVALGKRAPIRTATHCRLR